MDENAYQPSVIKHEETIITDTKVNYFFFREKENILFITDSNDTDYS